MASKLNVAESLKIINETTAACDQFESTNGELKKKERVLKKLMEDYVKKYDEVKTWKKAAEEALDRHEGHGYYSLSPMPPRLAEVVKPFTPRDWFEDSFSESVPASLERETDSQHNNTTIVSSSCADQLDDV